MRVVRRFAAGGVLRIARRRLGAGVAAMVAVLGLSAMTNNGMVPLTNARLASTGFVQLVGGKLYADGMPWSFTGYDDFTLPSTSPGFQCGGARSDASIDQEFAAMQQQSGSTAVRTWFFQSYGGPGNWSQFDRVLNLAAAHGIRVIPTLTNEWLECEGLPKAIDSLRYRNLQWWQSGYLQPDVAGRLSFKDFAVAMAQHYANNPTIAFWQIINEGEAKTSLNGTCDNTAAGDAMRAMADNVSAAMKAVDPNHLINLGTMGGGQCGTQGSMYGYVNGSATTDICEIHDYTNQTVMGDQWNGTVPDINACNAMHKPLFAGEVGIDAAVQSNWSVGSTVTAQTLTTRSGFFQQKLESLFRLGGVGFLIWSYGLGTSGGWVVGAGDPTQAMMNSEQAKLNANDTIGGLIVTDGDPSPGGGNTPGASVGALHTAASTTATLPRVTRGAASSAPTAAGVQPQPMSAAAAAAPPVTLLSVPLTGWLLHHTR